MNYDNEYLARQFEDHRAHLRRVAYRMLGSLGEAEDAVQEAWLRLTRAEASGIDNLAGWLTTVVSRVVMESQLRRYRCGEIFLMRIRKRFFTECMLISGGSARRLPGSTLRT